MKITTRGRYGLRALIDIAAHGGECVTLKSIARRQGISEHYLEQLAVPLRKAGFVQSVRGAQGGYALRGDPADISIGDVLRALEGPLQLVDCLAVEGEGSCGSADCSTCCTKTVWQRMYNQLNDTMDSIKLQELVQDYQEQNSILGE